MRKDCKSVTEQLVLNEKLMSFLVEMHRLKKYEDDKKRMMKSDGEGTDDNSKP